MAATSKTFQVTDASTGATSDISSIDIVLVIPSGSGSKVNYMKDGATPIQLVVTQSPASISASSGYLLPLTNTATSVVFYVNVDRVVNVYDNGSGSKVEYNASLSEDITYIVNESRSAIRAAIAAIVSTSTGDQSAIQFEDEGVNLGTSGTATEVDFVGAGVTATRVLNKVTVTVPGGSGGLSAYGYAAAQADAVIGANADVIFDLGATVFPNAGFTSVPAPAGTTFVIATTGEYEFNFFVRGTHAAAATTPLQFALWRNGAVASVGGNAFEFSGQCLSGVATEEQTCYGQGIIHLTAADTITLHNRTNTVTDAVTVTSVAGGVGAGHPNATLSLKRIA